MNNKVYYIKPINNDFPETIKEGLVKAFWLIKNKGFSNVKIVLSTLGLLNSPPNHISNALDKIFKGQGVPLTTQLKNNRGISIKNFPVSGQTTGVNLLLTNNELSFVDDNTVVVLLWSDYDSFRKIQSLLFWTKIELISIIHNETPKLNELLSASNAINISSTVDPNVIAYTNSFDPNTNRIIGRLKSINITDCASHTPTRERMESVISELKNNQIFVSYIDFLGFLVNEVNFKLKDSIELLDWKHKYFGR